MELYLKNIGKIEETTIAIRGITVIAGENNTGKSTVGRALFSVFNGFYEIEEQIHEERFSGIANILQLINRRVAFSGHDLFTRIDDFVNDLVENKDKYIKCPLQILEGVRSVFGIGDDDYKKLSDILNVEKDICDRILELLKVSDDEILESVLNKRIDEEFKGQILNVFSDTNGMISLKIKNEMINLDITENAVYLDEPKYNLHTRAVYIDDPFVLDDNDYVIGQKFFSHREQLKKQLLSIKSNPSVVEEIVMGNKLEKIYDKLSAVCAGNILRQNNRKFVYQINNSDKMLNMNNLSTGIKMFAIIKTLLLNGVIQDNGTLILDEPEIHLHPEWQLAFAELIVLIHKEFGLHILLNTHSPYFLRAIQVYSAKYEVGDMCNYYLAENGENGVAFIKDVTDSIDEIYKKLSAPLQRLEDERWSVD